MNYSPTLFDPVYGFWNRESCAIFGLELESFNQKSGIIQSGANTMQTTFVFELNFDGNELYVNCDINSLPDYEISNICTMQMPSRS